jgi:hypothetical protein
MRRGGFQLMEILVALAIAAGPLLFSAHLVQSSAATVHALKELTTAQFVLIDLLNVFAGDSIEDLRELASPGQADRLSQLVENRIARMPEFLRNRYRDEIRTLAGTFDCRLEEEVGGQKGLVRLTVSLMRAEGVPVTVFRLLRPAGASSLPEESTEEEGPAQ